MTDMCIHNWAKLHALDMHGESAVLVACEKCGKREVVSFCSDGTPSPKSRAVDAEDTQLVEQVRDIVLQMLNGAQLLIGDRKP